MTYATWLKHTKKNEPYYIYYGEHDTGIGFVDDDNKWRIHTCQHRYYDIDKLDKVAFQNTRQLLNDNLDNFANGYALDKITEYDKMGILRHMRATFSHAADGDEWQVITNELLYRRNAEWRFDEILRHITFKKNDIKVIRTPENPKKNTFDYIHMPIGLSGSNKKEFVRENYKEIVKRAIKVLSESKRFTRFGIPVNCLKVEKAVLTRQDELLLTFGLKEIKMSENADEKKGETA